MDLSYSNQLVECLSRFQRKYESGELQNLLSKRDYQSFQQNLQDIPAQVKQGFLYGGFVTAFLALNSIYKFKSGSVNTTSKRLLYTGLILSPLVGLPLFYYINQVEKVRLHQIQLVKKYYQSLQ